MAPSFINEAGIILKDSFGVPLAKEYTEQLEKGYIIDKFNKYVLNLRDCNNYLFKITNLIPKYRSSIYIPNPCEHCWIPSKTANCKFYCLKCKEYKLNG